MVEYVGYIRNTANTGFHIRVERQINNGNDGSCESLYEGKGYRSYEHAKDSIDAVIDVFKALDDQKDSCTDWERV